MVMMPFTQEEKRLSPRIKLQAPLCFQLRGSPRSCNALTDDLSSGGLSFTNDKFIAHSSTVMLEFNLLSRALSVIGKVVWSSPLPHSDRYRLGVQFDEVGQQDKNFLDDYIAMQLGNM